MDAQELQKKLDQQDEKLDVITHDVKRIKQYFLWTLIGSVVTFILPLIAAAIILPLFLGKYLNSLDGII